MSAIDAVESVRALATDPRSPLVALEVRSHRDGVRFLLGCEPASVGRVVQALGAVAVGLSMPRTPVQTARKLTIPNRQRPLATDALEVTAPAILSALNACQGGEELVLQVLLGPRLSGVVVPSTARQPVPITWLLVGYPANNRDGRMDHESHAALVKKVCEPGFCAVVRIGVSAKTPARRQALVLGLLGALRRLQSPGVTIYLSPEKTARVDGATSPWRWPLRLNIHEVAAVTALPVGEDLPGLPSLHPLPLRPTVGPFTVNKNRVIVAKTTAPGVGGDLTRSTEALLRHTHIVGPTGVGKSVLLANLVLQDIDAGRGAVVIEPKGDLVEDILARVPEHRRDDVVVLDPAAKNVVGLNPLAGDGSPELKADAVLSVFVDLFGDALGPRTTDILHSCLLTLARRSDASLVQIPRLLTDPAFRGSRVGAVTRDPALGSFWAWYSDLGDSERASVIAPLMNKLRAVLLRPSIRNVLGQTRPKFDVRDVLRASKILLVPLPVAALGQEGSALLGSLVVSQLWDAARERTRVPESRRQPVSIVLDEAQQFMHLPTDLSDALAMSRSYGIGWTLAHQYLSQLPTAMRSAVLTNCRSCVVFQTTRDDAKVFADETGGDLTVDDFTRLPAFHAYASMLEHGSVQPYSSGKTYPLPEPICDGHQLRRRSGERYGRPVDEIEAEFAAGTAKSVTDSVSEVASMQASADGRRQRVFSGRFSGRVTNRHQKTASPGGPIPEMSAETSSDDDAQLPCGTGAPS